MKLGVTSGGFFRLCAFAIGAFAAMGGVAAAETLIDDISSGKKLTITLGAEARITPSWEGSDQYDWMPMPLFDIREAGTAPRFHSPRDGLNITVFESGKFSAGPTGWVEFARRSKNKNSSALLGMDDVKTAVEIGGFAEYWFYDWLRGHGELRRGISGHHGVVLDLALDFVKPVQPGLTWSAGPRMRVADSSANSRYFDISPTESTLSGLPAYNAGAGVRSVGAGTQLIKQWTPEWATHAFVEYDRLVADAANSPLVQLRGNANQLTFGAGFAYSFDVGGK